MSIDQLSGSVPARIEYSNIHGYKIYGGLDFPGGIDAGTPRYALFGKAVNNPNQPEQGFGHIVRIEGIWKSTVFDSLQLTDDLQESVSMVVKKSLDEKVVPWGQI